MLLWRPPLALKFLVVPPEEQGCAVLLGQPCKVVCLQEKKAVLAAALSFSRPLPGLPGGPDHRWDTGNSPALTLASAVPWLPSSPQHPWSFKVTAAAGRVRPYPDVLNGARIRMEHGLTQRHGQCQFSLPRTQVLRSFPQKLGPAAASEVPASRTTCHR